MFWHIYVVCFQPNLPWSIDHFPAGCWHWRLAWCFFCICLGLLTVGSSQVQTQKWKQLQLATNHVWNRMLDFFVARCWERVQSFDWAMHFFWWGWRWRWGLGLLTVGSSQVQTQKWKELKLATITFGTECWYFFCGKMLGKNPVFFDWAMLFFLWAWRWRWGLGLLTVGSSQVQTPNWKESVQAGNKSRLEQNAGFFFVARGWERVQSFDWAMHFCLVRLTVGPYR